MVLGVRFSFGSRPRLFYDPRIRLCYGTREHPVNRGTKGFGGLVKGYNGF